MGITPQLLLRTPWDFYLWDRFEASERVLSRQILTNRSRLVYDVNIRAKEIFFRNA